VEKEKNEETQKEEKTKSEEVTDFGFMIYLLIQPVYYCYAISYDMMSSNALNTKKYSLFIHHPIQH
jgi:hypothetical protein